MRLTDRDLDLFKWINGWGVVTLPQVCRYWGVRYPTGSARIGKLVRGGYLRSDRILHGQPGVLRVTYYGVKLIDDDLNYLSNISLGTLRHDLKVVSLALDLGVSNIAFQDRRIRHELASKGLDRINRGIHIPDFEYPDKEFSNKKIAVEVELTRKKKERVKKIVKFYLSKPKYSKIIYFTDPSITKFIRQQVEQYPRIFEVNEL